METTSTTTETGGMSKLTIGIIVVIVLILIGVAFFVYSKTTTMPAVVSSDAKDASATPSPAAPKGNDYVSGETINKRGLSNFAKFNTAPYPNRPTDAIRQAAAPAASKARWAEYDSYWVAIQNVLGLNPPTDEEYVSGFMKGMDLAQTRKNVIAFKKEILDYMANDNKSKHWDGVDVGMFLK